MHRIRIAMINLPQNTNFNVRTTIMQHIMLGLEERTIKIYKSFVVLQRCQAKRSWIKYLAKVLFIMLYYKVSGEASMQYIGLTHTILQKCCCWNRQLQWKKLLPTFIWCMHSWQQHQHFCEMRCVSILVFANNLRSNAKIT